jgi:integrase
MARETKPKRKTAPRRVLRLPDLDLAKRTVLNSLGSLDSIRAHAHAIDDFIAWYCSEPRLAFGKHVVLRYRIELESRLLAPATINVRLAAVRRLAYEAADSGLLSPELAAGIQRVKGAKKLGVRLGNWLTVDECRRLLRAPDEQTLKGKRDRAVLAMLLGCGLRRAEVAKLQVRDLQQREEHWAVVDLIGKGRHIRTVPVPDWVKATLDEWTRAAAIADGRLFRCVPPAVGHRSSVLLQQRNSGVPEKRGGLRIAHGGVARQRGEDAAAAGETGPLRASQPVAGRPAAGAGGAGGIGLRHLDLRLAARHDDALDLHGNGSGSGVEPGRPVHRVLVWCSHLGDPFRRSRRSAS